MSLRQKQIDEILGYHDNINRDVFEREKKHVYYSGLQEAQPREKDLIVEAEIKQRVTAIQYDIQNITQSIHYTPSATLVGTIGQAYEEEEGEPGRYKQAIEQSNLARQKSGADNFDRMFSFLTKLIRDWNNLADYYLTKMQQNRYSEAQESALKDSISSLVDPLKDLLQKVVLLKPVTHDYYKIYNPIEMLLRAVQDRDNIIKLPSNIVNESVDTRGVSDPIQDLQYKTRELADEYDAKFLEEKNRFDMLKVELERPHSDAEHKRLLQEKARSKKLKQHYREQRDTESDKLRGVVLGRRKETKPTYSQDTKSLMLNKIADYDIRIRDVDMMIPSNKTEEAAINRLRDWYASEREKLSKFLSSGVKTRMTTDVMSPTGFIDEVPLSDIYKKDIQKRKPGGVEDKQLQQILSKLTPKNRKILRAGESKEPEVERESKDEPYGRSEYSSSRESEAKASRFGPAKPSRPSEWAKTFEDDVKKISQMHGLTAAEKDKYSRRIMSRESMGLISREEANHLTRIVEGSRTLKGSGDFGNFPDESSLVRYTTKHLKPSKFKNVKVEVKDSESDSNTESESESDVEPPPKPVGGKKGLVITNSPDKDLWFL